MDLALTFLIALAFCALPVICRAIYEHALSVREQARIRRRANRRRGMLT